jgi:hypothetical protein
MLLKHVDNFMFTFQIFQNQTTVSIKSCNQCCILRNNIWLSHVFFIDICGICISKVPITLLFQHNSHAHQCICPFWHEFQKPVTVKLQFLHLQLFKNSHFHFITIVESTTSQVMLQFSTINLPTCTTFTSNINVLVWLVWSSLQMCIQIFFNSLYHCLAYFTHTYSNWW